MLTLDRVAAGYGRIDALHGISLTVGAAEFVCLIGANGAGKTTTLKTISGLVRAAAGRIVFDGREIQRLAPQEIKNELAISQDGRIKGKFYIQVSNRMAPHLIAAIQHQADSESGIGMKSYFYRLQEQIMSEMFAGVKDVIG